MVGHASTVSLRSRVLDTPRRDRASPRAVPREGDAQQPKGSRDAVGTDQKRAAPQPHGARRHVIEHAHPDASEHLRGAMRTATEMLAKLRDVGAALYAMSALDPDSVGGAIVRQEERRWGGMQHVARRLAEQGELRDDVSVEEAADVLWMLASFEAFDALYSGRGLPTDQVARLLVATAERTLCR